MNNPPLVLLVDDFEDNRDLYEEYLLFKGYRVLTADNGADGVRMACERRPDIILLDLRMPGMSGQEALMLSRHGRTSRPSRSWRSPRMRSRMNGVARSHLASTRSSPSHACRMNW